MTDQPTTGYDKHLADERADYPPPEQRVREYLDALDEHDRIITTGWTYGDTIHGYNTHELSRTDIRDVLNELAEHRSLLEQVDAQLDRLNGTNDADVLSALCKLLGNHTGQRRKPPTRFTPHAIELEGEIL